MELESGRIVIGEFKEFKGRPEDAEVLAFAKRSSVSNLSMTHRRGWMDNLFGKHHLFGVIFTSSDSVNFLSNSCLAGSFDGLFHGLSWSKIFKTICLE